MGCDIHSFAVREDGSIIKEGIWQDGKTANPDYEWLDNEGEPFGNRNYGVFGFLANVRNYSDVPAIAQPRGLPSDFQHDEDRDGWVGDHSFSWLSLDELKAFDYDAAVEDRRVTRQIGPNSWDGGCTADAGGGKMMTWREFLGDAFFKDMAELERIGAHRVVFGFDS